ncbi:hypothetical protein KCU67_g410, partial [Aureobasidium melanogenum]
MPHIIGTTHGHSNKPLGQAAAWSLMVPANNPVSPESAIMAEYGGHHGPDGWESIIGIDERELVDPHDISDATASAQEAYTSRKNLTFGTESSLIAETPFIEGLFAPTKPIAGEKGVFDWLGSALNAAVNVAKPLVSQAAKAAITDLGPKLVDKILGRIGVGIESLPVRVGLSREPEVKLLLERALVADTALQALQALPKSKLDALLATAGPDGEIKGIFDSINNVVQMYGPTVLGLAKDAVKTYAPVIVKAVTDKLTEDTPMASLPVPIIDGKSGLRKMTSIYDFIEGINVSHPLPECSQEAIAQGQDVLVSGGIPKSVWDNPDAPPIVSQPTADFPA